MTFIIALLAVIAVTGVCFVIGAVIGEAIAKWGRSL